MTSQLSRWSVLALLPALAITCSTEPEELGFEETDTEAGMEETGEEEFRGHENTSVPGSNFEIDANANLLKDHPDPSPTIDWVNVSEARYTDKTPVNNDDSFVGGTKEDDPCPKIETGSIPKNKSDLKHFGVYHEPGDPGEPGYMHLYWTRVQEPSGTTLMDFEFNQSEERCNPSDPTRPFQQRTVGDLLLEYRIEQGGNKTATLKKRTWNGSAWSTAEDLTQAQAIGTINQTLIQSNNADGLGQLSPFTFGEASINLKAIFGVDEPCKTFGRAVAKSRASDTFTSAMKDVAGPLEIDISNCGKITVHKETIPDGASESFTFTAKRTTNPTAEVVFQLQDGQSSSPFAEVLFGTYEIIETPHDDFDLESIDCQNNPIVDVDEDSNKVTFVIDDDADEVDCTFTNAEETSAIRIHKDRSDATEGVQPHAGVTFEVSGGNLSSPIQVITDQNGDACVSGLELSTQYTVTETEPANYKADDDEQFVVTSGTGSTCESTPTTVNFFNRPLSTLVCEVDPQVPGATVSTIECNGVEDDGILTVEDLPPGTYECTIMISDGT